MHAGDLNPLVPKLFHNLPSKTRP